MDLSREENESMAARVSEGGIPSGGGRLPRKVRILIFSGLVAAGVFGGMPSLWPAAQRAMAAQEWPQVVCRILTSEVREVPAPGGAAYGAAILYSYAFRGTVYHSSVVDLENRRSRGHAEAQRLVDAHAAGSECPCYVNPQDPADAVLDRSPVRPVLTALVPLSVVLVGAVGLLRLRRKRSAE